MIRWMAEHKVAANLLMVIILVAGVMGVSTVSYTHLRAHET